MFQDLESYAEVNGGLKSLAAYDFKNESLWRDVNEEGDSLEKFELYKARAKKERGGFSLDCDSSILARDLYLRLWGWDYDDRLRMPESLHRQLGGRWNRLGPDTMNSFQTTYNVAKRLLGGRVKDNELLREFSALTHSVGNFTLVPFHLEEGDSRSFNQSRGFGGRYFVHDFFDLSLKLIKDHTSQEVFKSYIDTFYLNDYVDDAYNVLPLFERHGDFLGQEPLDTSSPIAFLPKTEEELNEYLGNVIQLIKARGERIATALEGK